LLAVAFLEAAAVAKDSRSSRMLEVMAPVRGVGGWSGRAGGRLEKS
jgi:hypothetical protein